MTAVSPAEKDAFFQDVEAAAKKAIWCALATVDGNEPRVRMVHPTWEGDVLWVATGPTTPKATQIQANGAVDVQFQVAPDDFVHLMVQGQCGSTHRSAHQGQDMGCDGLRSLGQHENHVKYDQSRVLSFFKK